MRELQPTLRNGIGQLREPPLHYLENQNDSQFLTANNQLFNKNYKWRLATILKNGAESEKPYE